MNYWVTFEETGEGGSLLVSLILPLHCAIHVEKIMQLSGFIEITDIMLYNLGISGLSHKAGQHIVDIDISAADWSSNVSSKWARTPRNSRHLVPELVGERNLGHHNRCLRKGT